MNKIKEAFSTIKIDDSLKDKTYSYLKNRQTKKIPLFTPIIILNTVLVMTLVFIFNYDKPNNNKFIDTDMSVGVLSESTLGFNSFTYKDDNYMMSSMIIKSSDLDINIGPLDQLVVMDISLEDNENYQLYTVRKNDKVLVIKRDDKLYPFEKQ